MDRCTVYVGLFGNEYGYEDAEGISPTEREFQRATQKHKPRFIFVKGTDDKARDPKMLKLIRSASSQLVRPRFVGIPDLTAALYASLVEHFERQTKAVQLARTQGRVTSADLQKSTNCSRATALRDLEGLVVKRILRRTGEKRGTHYLPVAKPPKH